jgi:hypothetical protein
MTAGFVVEKPEVFTLGEADYEALHQGWVKALKTLPDGTVFHMQDVYVRDEYRIIIHELDKLVSLELRMDAEVFFFDLFCGDQRFGLLEYPVFGAYFFADVIYMIVDGFGLYGASFYLFCFTIPGIFVDFLL